MSQLQPAKQDLSNRPLGRDYEPTRVAAPNGSYSPSVNPAVVTVTQLDFGNSQYESAATYETRLSEEEILLLREKETLTKAVEALKLKREAVAAARRKTEEEVGRLAREEEARSRATKEALLRAEAQRRLLETEEAVLRQATQFPQPGVKFEPPCEPAPSEILLEEMKMPMRLHERLRELALQERLRTEHSDGGALAERLQVAEPPSLRNKALLERQEQASLEQRLRAEIEGMAAAQRRSVDAARAQVSLQRSSNPAQAQTAL